MRFVLRSVTAVLVLLTARVTPAAQSAAPATPTFTVNSTSDVVASAPLANGICETAPGNGICTLRAAIMKANHWPGGGASILLPALPPGATYTLTIPRVSADETNGALSITANVTIQGSGASDTIINGNSSHTNDSVFRVYFGNAVTMTGVTIRGGGSSDGGGIANGGNLVLYSSAIVGNQSTIEGGGVANIGAGNLTVYTSTVSGNQSNVGGGIANDQGSVTLIATTVSSNTANNDGGGLWNSDNNFCPGGRCTITLVNGTVSNNGADRNGGGISNFKYLRLVNSTVSSNSAAGDGGGIWNGSQIPTLFNTTVAHNLADANLDGTGTGGGVFSSSSGSVQMQNSLLADNLASDYDPDRQVYFGVPNDCHGLLRSNDYNLVSDTANCTFSASPNDQTNVAAGLGPLQDNGGPTWTHALLPGSPAIDSGNLDRCRDSLGAPLTTDQRGFPRHANGAGTTRCDIGAYEVQRLLNLPLVIR